MADYAKLVVKGIYSKSSDYSDPKVTFNPAAVALTPDEYIHEERRVPAGYVWVITSAFTSVSCVMVKNLDTVNYVTVTYDSIDQAGSKTRIPAGGVFVITELVHASNVKLAAAVACECEIFITGT